MAAEHKYKHATNSSCLNTSLLLNNVFNFHFFKYFLYIWHFFYSKADQEQEEEHLKGKGQYSYTNCLLNSLH